MSHISANQANWLSTTLLVVYFRKQEQKRKEKCLYKLGLQISHQSVVVVEASSFTNSKTMSIKKVIVTVRCFLMKYKKINHKHYNQNKINLTK